MVPEDVSTLPLAGGVSDPQSAAAREVIGDEHITHDRVTLFSSSLSAWCHWPFQHLVQGLEHLLQSRKANTKPHLLWIPEQELKIFKQNYLYRMLISTSFTQLLFNTLTGTFRIFRRKKPCIINVCKASKIFWAAVTVTCQVD